MSIANGDLVYVSWLDSSMSHFEVKLGVVCKKEGSEFFLQSVNSDLKLIARDWSGWYGFRNVTMLKKNYIRGRLDGKTIYNTKPDNTSLGLAKKHMDTVQRKVLLDSQNIFKKLGF